MGPLNTRRAHRLSEILNSRGIAHHLTTGAPSAGMIGFIESIKCEYLSRS
jgi:hypothetical protein